MSEIDDIKLDTKIKINHSQIMNLSKIINMEPSLYLKVGAIHGCVLCDIQTKILF